MSNQIKIKNTQLVLLLLLASMVGFVIGLLYIKEKRLTPTQERFNNLISLIETEYVDTVNTDSLLRSAMNHIMVELDPHSKYLDSLHAEKVDRNLKGSFMGIGVLCDVLNDTLVVQHILEDSPNRHKFLIGDKLLKAEEVSLTGEGIHMATNHLNGIENTQVNILLMRDGKLLNKTLVRKNIIRKAVKQAYMIRPTVGYIKIETFAQHSSQQFHENILNLKAQGMESLIVDLRDNAGGYLGEARNIIDEFLPAGDLMYYLKKKNEVMKETHASSKGAFENGGLYILINERSASAAELLAGAIQDQDRGTILGRRSFGKGMVQQDMTFSDGTKIRLTTARYYTPSGRSIQKPFDKGWLGYYQYGQENKNRTQAIEETIIDQRNHSNTPKYKTKSGRTVYGGGGIIPDIHINSDFVKASDPLFKKLEIFVRAQAITHKKTLKSATLEDFNRNFEPENLMSQFKSIARESVDKLTVQEQRRLEQSLKALLARCYYGEEGFRLIYNEIDTDIRKTLSILNYEK